MVRGRKLLLVVAAIGFISTMPAIAKADDEKLTGVIIGRGGEVLHLSVPQPVREGTIFAVKLLESVEPIAEVRVVSCTHERPFIALAKVVRADMQTTVPTGVRAYANVDAVEGPEVPKPMKREAPPDDNRFSLQAGAFYPSAALLQDTIADYWQAYRLNYTFLRMKGLETLLSAEYTKGTGDFESGGSTGTRSMEVVPLTVMGRIKPVRMGSAHLFLGAGAGLYRIRSEERLGAAVTSSSTEEFGREFAVGLESRRGWILELRYRDVENTDIEGYSLTIGARF